MVLRKLFAGVAVVALIPAAAAAQSGAGASQVEAIVVQGMPLSRASSEMTAPVVQLGGDELVFQRRATLGDTLSSQPGINSDTFGGGASRPVIRGQVAPRVKVLSDGAEIVDASQISPDHAVVAEPLLIEEIEVMRGPSALLYGGGAIGGAVNLIDSRIPRRRPTGGLAGVAEVRGGTNADERAGVFGATVGVGPMAFRIEGAARGQDDYKAGGSFGRVPGTYSESQTGTLGASLVGAMGYLGAAYTRQTSDYGIPGHEHEFESCHPHGLTLHCGGHGEEEDDHDHDHGAGAEEAAPNVRLQSDRFDVRGEWRDPFAGISRLRLRGGATTYRHDEIDEGEVGTTFKNRGWDGRLEIEHQPLAGWRGVLGLQGQTARFNALGSEAFLPPNRTRTGALFLLEERSFGDLRVELAARQEWQRIESAANRVGALAPPVRRDAPFSASAGAVWNFTPGYSLAASYSRSQRAPSAQELFARGVHLASNTYELGTPTLRKETSNAVDLTFRKTDGATTFTASGFVNRFDGYIFAETLDRFEGFRLIRYAQADARFMGLEAEVRHELTDDISLVVFGDYVRAKFTGGGDLPRIPAGRLGAHLDVSQGSWMADVEYFHVFSQGRVADFESRTGGYDMLNLTLAYSVPLAGARGQVYVRAANLLDQLALNHTSFVKEAAPMSGRTFTLGLRTQF